MSTIGESSPLKFIPKSSWALTTEDHGKGHDSSILEADTTGLSGVSCDAPLGCQPVGLCCAFWAPLGCFKRETKRKSTLEGGGYLVSV